MVKICEVVDGCEDCPKYGDDCDGDKRTESTDRISRADAIEAVAQQWLFEASVGNPYVNDDDIGEYRKLAEELFEDVPSADAVPQSEQYKKGFEDAKRAYEIELARSADAEWIPVSERLPKEKARVLTYDTMGDVVFGQYDKGKWYWEAEACADYWAKNDGVIAWMPLPTPYKGGAE